MTGHILELESLHVIEKWPNVLDFSTENLTIKFHGIPSIVGKIYTS